MEKYIIAPPAGSQTNAIGAKDRPWKEVHAKRYPGLNEYLAESTGYGIVSGCEPSISGLTVTVGAGVVHLADGTRKEIVQTNITLDNADPTNPRIDLVYINADGEVAKVTGTAAASPSVPAVPTGGISVAQVNVAAGATTGTIADSRDFALSTNKNVMTVKKLVADDVTAKGPVVDVRAFGAVGDGVTDDTAAIQAAIDYAVNSKSGILLIPAGIYYISSGIVLKKSGEVYIDIYATGAVLKTDKNIDAFTLKSAAPLSEYNAYNKRVSKVGIHGLRTLQMTQGVGRGIVCYIYGNEILLDRTISSGFNYGHYISEGSEIVLHQVNSYNNNYGLFVGAEELPPIVDAQGIYLDECNIHNNGTCNLICRNLLELYITGGSWMAIPGTGEGGIVFDTACGLATVCIEKIDFEQNKKPSVIVNSHPANLIFSQNQVAPEDVNVPVIDVKSGNNMAKLTVQENYLDTVFSKWVKVESTVGNGYVFDLINNIPFKTSLLFADERSGGFKKYAQLTPYTVFKGWGSDLNYGRLIYNAITQSTYDTTEFITGTGSYKFYKMANAVVNVLILMEGKRYVIEVVCKHGSAGGKTSPLTVVPYNKNTSSYESATPINDYQGVPDLSIQNLSNGFYHSLIPIQVPANYNLLLRMSPQWDLTEFYYIDYIAVYCEDEIETENYKLPRLSAAPTEGTHEKGDVVYNSSTDAGGKIGWTCVTAGTPGTWKGFGAIDA